MSERDGQNRNSSVDRSRKPIEDPPAGLDRLKEAVRRILKVPKSAIDVSDDEERQARPT